MRPPLEYFFPPEIGAELIYSFVIIACSLMVYYATKEMYELSSYKGLKYFRQAFLFFAIAFFSRYFIKFLLMFFNVREILEFSPVYLGGISLFIFLYSSSMAVFYLLYSVMWKKWNHSELRIYLFNLFAVIIAMIGVLSRGILTSLILIVVLLLSASFILFIAYKNSRNSRKGKNLYVIYLLLFIFCILNIFDILIPAFLQMYQIVIYLASSLIFMIILYKVLRHIGN
jgi:hypothetical protein